MYLAVFLDLFSRRVVGWALGTHLTADLVLRALKQAILIRRPPPGLIIHTDRGSQYTSDVFIALVQQDQFTMSMSRKGNCWDNAVVESFFATLKRELIVGEKIRYRYQLKEMVTDYIDRYYNQVRMHSSLDYKSPMEYEKQRA
jgi:transposase InsO family protein